MYRSFCAALICGVLMTFGSACTGTDAGGGASAATPANHCLLDGAAPFTPTRSTGSFDFHGMDAGPLPALNGGDPVGNWGVDSFTLYLSDTVQSLVDLEASSIGGQSWVEMTPDGEFRLAFDMSVRVIVAGEPIIDGQVLAGGIGSYTMGGNAVQVSERCFYSEGLGDEGAADEDALDRNISFESSGDTGRFLIRMQSEFGDIGILVDVSRR